MKQHTLVAGGRPWHGTDFVDLQNEPLTVLQSLVEPAGPSVLSGCVVTGSGPTYNISAGIVSIGHADGWKVARFAAVAGVTLPGYLVISKATVNKVYDDTISRVAYYDYTATFTNTLPGSGSYLTITTDGAVGFNAQLALSSITALDTIALSAAGGPVITGNLKIRKNRAAGLLYLNADLSLILTGSPGNMLSTHAGVLPAKYRPTTRQYFIGHVQYNGSNQIYDTGTPQAPIQHLTGYIEPSGDMVFYCIEPDVVTTYDFHISAVLNLL